MQLDELERRLATLPAYLPPTPRELIPVAVADGGERTGSLPRFADLPRRDAAVLLLLHADPAGEALLTLTERSAGGHRHAGQVSLPGGAIDESDESPIAAALREAREEVGLDPDQAGVTVIGMLPEVDVRVSGFVIRPVVAVARQTPRLVPDGYEVASIFDAPISAFLPGAPIETVTAERDGYVLRYGGYRIGSHHVWGATAFLLGRLGTYLSGVSG